MVVEVHIHLVEHKHLEEQESLVKVIQEDQEILHLNIVVVVEVEQTQLELMHLQQMEVMVELVNQIQ